MTIYKQRDIILVKFIFSGGIGFKKRPALVLSSAQYHEARQEVIAAAITSNTDRLLTGDTKIKEWKAARLLAPSVAMALIQTLKGNLIERVLGALDQEDFQQVQKNLKVAFAF